MPSILAFYECLLESKISTSLRFLFFVGFVFIYLSYVECACLSLH